MGYIARFKNSLANNYMSAVFYDGQYYWTIGPYNSAPLLKRIEIDPVTFAFTVTNYTLTTPKAPRYMYGFYVDSNYIYLHYNASDDSGHFLQIYNMVHKKIRLYVHPFFLIEYSSSYEDSQRFFHYKILFQCQIDL